MRPRRESLRKRRGVSDKAEGKREWCDEGKGSIAAEEDDVLRGRGTGSVSFGAGRLR
jgi:hypothetical protein